MRKTIVLVALLGANVASADQLVRYAAPTVTEIRSDAASGSRAITGVENGEPFLVIEHVQRGRVTDQQAISEVRVGRNTMPIESVAGITLVGWKRGKLELAIDTGKNELRCMTTRSYKVRCHEGSGSWDADADDADAPPPPPPHADGKPSMADLEAVTDACNAVFQYNSSDVKQACVNEAAAILKTRHRAKAALVVKSCDKAFQYNSADVKQACIRTVYKGSYDPVELVDYCVKNNQYASSDKVLQCMSDLAAK